MTWVIPTIHPATIMHGGRAPILEVISADLAKAWRVAQTGQINQHEQILVVHPAAVADLEGAVRTAVAWMQHWKTSRCPVSTDVETSGLSQHRCAWYSIALSGVDGNDVALGWTMHDLHTMPYEAERVLCEALRALMADDLVPKVFQNGPFDRPVMALRGYPVFGQCIDTLGLHHLVQPDSQHDLGWIGHTYLDVEPWKLDEEGEGLGRKFIHDVVRGLVYNCKDALNTGKLVDPLTREIVERGMNQRLIDLQMWLADLCTIMELRGLPINLAKRHAMGEALRIENEQLTAELRQMLAWPDFNPLNGKHRIEVYYGEKYLKLKPTAWSEKRHDPSTSYKNQTIIEALEHPIVNRIVKIQEQATKYTMIYSDTGAYARALERDGRLYCKWSIGQRGSRLSSSPNVQNLALKDRDFIEAPDGWVLVAADKDQLELRVAAGLAGVRELLDEMARPDGDPHTLAARQVWGDKFDQMPKDERKKLRDAVKNVVYASLYMAGVKRVWHTVREKKIISPEMRAMLTLPFVSHVYHSYLGKFVEFKRYHDWKWNNVQSNGRLVAQPFGRVRIFPAPGLAEYNEVANWDVQVAGSDFVAAAMQTIQWELQKRFDGACIILHGHDQVVVECRERHAEDVKKLVDQLFGNDVLDGPAGPVRLTAKAHVGKDLHAVK